MREKKGNEKMAKHNESGGDRFQKKLDREKEYKKQLPGEDEEPLPPPVEPIHSAEKPGRNEPCPCGSGKKYKQCCGK
jgi:preprotein translocase subunit SecA